MDACKNCRKSFNVTGDRRRLPFLLNCGHTLCGPCVSRKKTILSCPECGKKAPYDPTKSPEEQLVVNVHSLGVAAAKYLKLRCHSQLHKSWDTGGANAIDKDMQSDQEVKEADILCEECKISVADYKCVKCDALFCHTCFQVVHAAGNTLRRHKPLPAHQATFHLPTCTTHPALTLSYFCQTEELPVCSDCILAHHKDHKVLAIGEVVTSYRTHSEKQVSTMETILNDIKRKQQELTSMLANFWELSLTADQSVDLHIGKLYTVLQKRELTLHKEIAQTVDQQVAPLMEMEKVLAEHSCRVARSIRAAKELMKNDVKLLQDKDQLDRALREVQNIHVPNIPAVNPISFTPSPSVKQAIEEAGSIQVNTPPPSSLLPPPPPPPEANSNHVHTDSLTARRSLSPNRPSHSPPPSQLAVRTSPSPSPSPSPTSAILKLDRQRTTLSPLASSFTPNKRASSSRGSSNASGGSRSRTASPVPATRREDTVAVWVSHTDSPGEFYIQVKAEVEELQKMSHTLNELCSAQEHSREIPVKSIREGLKVAAKYSGDDLWYRAEVTSVFLSPPPSYVVVIYTDYGNSENVTLDKVVPLPSSLADGPFYGYRCCLVGLHPPGKFANVAPPSWSANAITRFANMVDDNNDVVMKEQGRSDGCREVELFTVSADNSLRSVADSLLQMGLAARGKKRDKASAQFTIPPLPLPKPSPEVVGVTVSACTSPNDFYVQLASKTNAWKMLHAKLQKLKLHKVHCVYKGLVCVAQYSDKKRKYYRAVISGGRSDEGLIPVQYVDSGERGQVKEVWELPPELTQLPAQAIHCTLHNVAPLTGSVWPQEVLDRFISDTSGAVLMMEVCSEGLPLSVNLTHKMTQQTLNSLLVVEGLARHYDQYAAPVNTSQQPQLKGKKKTKRNRLSSPVVIPPTPTTPLSPAPLPVLPLRGLPSPTKTTPTAPPSVPPKLPSLPWPSLPVVGQKLECVVVQVTSPGEFSLQSVSYATDVQPLLAKVPSRQPSRQSWSVGDYCLATFNGEKWYRAEVVEEVSSASSSIKYEVVYIDFENRAILDVGDLAIMPPALEQYPAQAVKACLAGVLPSDACGTWHHMTSIFFSSLVLDKHVTVTVQATPADTSYLLPLKVSVAVSGSDVADILLSAKMALPDSADHPLPCGSTDYSGSDGCSCSSTPKQESGNGPTMIHTSPIVPTSPTVAPPPLTPTGLSPSCSPTTPNTPPPSTQTLITAES